jgi:hypothetical protein
MILYWLKVVILLAAPMAFGIAATLFPGAVNDWIRRTNADSGGDLMVKFIDDWKGVLKLTTRIVGIAVLIGCMAVLGMAIYSAARI